MIDQSVVQALLGVDRGVVERIVPGFVPDDWEREHVARYEWALAELRGLSSCCVLDVACGVGYGSSILGRAGHRVASLDLFRQGLRFGMANFSVRCPVAADAHTLPFGDGTFDAVVSLETIEHLVRPGLFARDVARVLKPHGTLLISTPNVDLTKQKNPHHLHEFTLEELTSLLDTEGLGVRKLFGQHFDWGLGFWTTIPGVRRFLWQLSRSNEVRPVSFLLRNAWVWCVKAVKED